MRDAEGTILEKDSLLSDLKNKVNSLLRILHCIVDVPVGVCFSAATSNCAREHMRAHALKRPCGPVGFPPMRFPSVLLFLFVFSCFPKFTTSKKRSTGQVRPVRKGQPGI